MSVNDIQHGGDHYRAKFQHWDFVADMGLDYYAANATKYITRHRKKNGREDVLKAQHYITKKMELIGQGRMPAPYEYHLCIQLARDELVNRFADANGIDPETNEFKFLQQVCLAQDVSDLNVALDACKAMLAEYDEEENTTVTMRFTHGGFVPAPPLAGPGTFTPVSYGKVDAIPSNVAAAMEPNFGPEGWWGDMTVLWKCKRCNSYFKGPDGVLPSTVHRECVEVEIGAATSAYVGQ